jgi:hypothetical protein
MRKAQVITRRDFLRGTAGVALAAALGSGVPSTGKAEISSKVIIIRNTRAVSKEGQIQFEIVQSMLDEALPALCGEKEAGTAWKRLFLPGDVVGIKSNSWNYLPTPPELEEALRRRLLDVGVKEKNIAVDDRGILNNPVFINSTALINVRPVRTHHWAGIGGCLKNYIMFASIPWTYHGEACSDLAKIWDKPMVKGKTRLNILSALTPQFYGRGAHSFDRRYVWPYKGLIIGTDPVAVDAVGAELLKRKRVAFFGEDRPLDVPPIHITAAEKKYKLGVSDLRRIQLIQLGWMEDALM